MTLFSTDLWTAWRWQTRSWWRLVILLVSEWIPELCTPSRFIITTARFDAIVTCLLNLWWSPSGVIVASNHGWLDAPSFSFLTGAKIYLFCQPRCRGGSPSVRLAEEGLQSWYCSARHWPSVKVLPAPAVRWTVLHQAPEPDKGSGRDGWEFLFFTCRSQLVGGCRMSVIAQSCTHCSIAQYCLNWVQTIVFVTDSSSVPASPHRPPWQRALQWASTVRKMSPLLCPRRYPCPATNAVMLGTNQTLWFKELQQMAKLILKTWKIWFRTLVKTNGTWPEGSGFFGPMFRAGVNCNSWDFSIHLLFY